MQINRAFPQFIPIMAATLSLVACGGPAPRAGDSRPSAPPVAPAPMPLPPRAAPPAPPAPRPAPTASAPAGVDWRDVPLPAGDWVWTARAGGGEARFGQAGRPPIAIMACDRAGGVVRIALPPDPAQGQSAQGQPAATRPATIATSTSSGTFVAEPHAIDALSTLAITLPVAHRLLDAMAFSRGRFRVEIGGLPPVVLPSWSEVGRVVEDCRGPNQPP